MLIAVWKKIVVKKEGGMIPSLRGVWTLEPTWPHEKPWIIVTVPDGWLFGRKRNGAAYVVPTDAPPIPLHTLVTKKDWTK